MKILIIDDDALVRKSLQFSLSQEGHEITTAKDGLEANEHLQKQLPDLIICDLLMPEVSGITFITILREYFHHDISVIIISTLDKGDVIAANLGIKNIEFMSKPIHFDDLIKKINNISKNKYYENPPSFKSE
jgi:DNA-binding response OmpR family regulator